jgi:hypothetical protein
MKNIIKKILKEIKSNQFYIDYPEGKVIVSNKSNPKTIRIRFENKYGIKFTVTPVLSSFIVKPA